MLKPGTIVKLRFATYLRKVESPNRYLYGETFLYDEGTIITIVGLKKEAGYKAYIILVGDQVLRSSYDTTFEEIESRWKVIAEP